MGKKLTRNELAARVHVWEEKRITTDDGWYTIVKVELKTPWVFADGSSFHVFASSKSAKRAVREAKNG